MSTLLNATQIFTYIGYILIAIVVLLLMVLIHELGHYTAGKILKFKIDEFSVGFGPKLLQKTRKNGEKISLRAFPLGGYCAFAGETENDKDNPQAYSNQKPWKRLIVLFCGAFFNFLSAIIFSFILLMSNGYDLIQVKYAEPTAITALQTGDVIYGVNGVKIDFVQDKYVNTILDDYIQNFKTYSGDITQETNSFIKDDKTFYMVQKPISFYVERDNKKVTVDGFINVIYGADGKCTGWSMANTYNDNNEIQVEYYKYSFLEALGESIPFTCKWAWKVLVVFGQLITGQLSITALGGPVTTINMIANFTQQNLLVVLLPLIAVNLAVFNLLPIPALDGFQMIFVVIEWIRKKPVKQEVVNLINNIGLLVLLGFVIVVDVLQFVL